MKRVVGLIVPVVFFAFIFTSCTIKNPRDLSLKDVPKSEDVENAKDVISKNKDILDQNGPPKTQETPAENPHIDNGINIHLKGDRNLNRYKKSPHALVLCIYQLHLRIGFRYFPVELCHHQFLYKTQHQRNPARRDI